MNLRQTHTYAALEVSAAAYDEIAAKLRAAGYDHAFDLEEKAIDMQGIGLVRAVDAESVTVPVLVGFDEQKPIGWLKVRKDALPATPDFCFSIGFMAKQGVFVQGSIPSSQYVGTYDLMSISPVVDESYARYLKQVGALDPVIAEKTHQPDADGMMNCVCDSSQAPAASMCERCPHRDAAVKHDLECWQMLMELRSEEGSSVDVLADNADYNSMPDRAIDCAGAWTGWRPRRFGAKTLHQALTDAITAMRGPGSPA